LLFIVVTPAGKNLFGRAELGEYFRVFASYGVIALALVLHGMQNQGRSRKKLERTGL
jgi:simple sugar transport system permease protein